MRFRSFVALPLVLFFLIPVPVAAGANGFHGVKRDIEKALRAGDVHGVLAGLDDLAAIDDEGDAKRIAKFVLKLGAKIPSSAIFKRARRVLRDIDAEDAVEYLVSVLEREKYRRNHRVMIVEAFADRRDEASLEGLAAALEDDEGAVRRAAVLACRKREDARLVDPLIDCLEDVEKDRGLIHSLARETLIAFLGDHGLEMAADWRSWWAAHQDEVEIGRVDASGATTESSTQARNPQFFGKEIASKRIVFVIDVSGSMRMTDPVSSDGRRRRPRTGKKGAGEKPRTDSRVRIDRARAELIGALGALADDARFTLIAYSGMKQMASSAKAAGQPKEKDKHIKVFSPRLVRSSHARKAAKWVEEMKAEGATYTHRALELAFKVEDADTIILLSDGAPMEFMPSGEKVTTDQILADVRTWNRFEKRIIHAFGFEGQGGGMGGMAMGGGPRQFVDFMKDLAKQNHGDYEAIR